MRPNWRHVQWASKQVPCEDAVGKQDKRSNIGIKEQVSVLRPSTEGHVLKRGASTVRKINERREKRSRFQNNSWNPWISFNSFKEDRVSISLNNFYLQSATKEIRHTSRALPKAEFEHQLNHKLNVADELVQIEDDMDLRCLQFLPSIQKI